MSLNYICSTLIINVSSILNILINYLHYFVILHLWLIPAVVNSSFLYTYYVLSQICVNSFNLPFFDVTYFFENIFIQFNKNFNSSKMLPAILWIIGCLFCILKNRFTINNNNVIEQKNRFPCDWYKFFYITMHT